MLAPKSSAFCRCLPISLLLRFRVPDAQGAPLRVLIVAKSPSAPQTSIAYRITAAGPEWVEGVEPLPVQPGSVLDMRIANEQAYEEHEGVPL
jgi:hypothetical protein